LFEAAFCEESEIRTLYSAKDTEFEKKLNKANKILKAMIHEDICLKYFPSEDEELSSVFEWNLVNLPIPKGEVVGKMVIRAKDDERVLLEKPFFAKEKVSKKIRYVITDALKENWIYMILAIFLGLVAYFGILKIYKVQ
jgi:hypothetical protein